MKQIGNPKRIIPAGKAINYEVLQQEFLEFIDDTNTEDTSYNSSARAMHRDNAPHLTTYGKVLVGLTWYEYNN